jgi:ABC-type transport system substrate-binding protein
VKIKSFLSRFRKKQVLPLVSDEHDLQLLRTVHGRKWPSIPQLFQVGRILSTSEKRLLSLCMIVLVISGGWVSYSTLMKYRVQVPAIGGRYVEAVVGTPQLINPVFASINDVDQDISVLVYTGLMRYDKNQELIPDLAESYTVSEDKKTYTFVLREGVLWHDGEPLTSRDVVFTIETIQNPGVNSPLRSGFQGVVVRVVDERTMEFVLKEPFAPFLGTLTLGILPEHVWFDVQPERFRLFKANLEPIGTGPYFVKKLSKNTDGVVSRYEFGRNERFYRIKPYIEEVVFQFYSSYDDGVIQDLRSQRVDGLSFVPHELKKKVERKHIHLYTPQLPQYTALFLNSAQQPILKDEQIKKALIMGLDKTQILKEALGGEGRIIHSPVLPGFPGYDESVGVVEYDLQTANATLDKVSTKIAADDFVRLAHESVTRDVLGAFVSSSPSSTITLEDVLSYLTASSTLSTGSVTSTEDVLSVVAEVERVIESQYRLNDVQLFYRRTKSGDLFEINLATADTQEYRRVAQSVAGYWESLGVKVNISYVLPKDIQRDILRSRKYDVLLYGIILGADPDQYPFWHSSQIEYPGLNLSSYKNTDVNKYLVEARETDDPLLQAELGAKIRDQISVDNPAVFLYMPIYTYAISDKVMGIELNSIYHPSDRFSNIESWYIETRGRWKKSESVE